MAPTSMLDVNSIHSESYTEVITQPSSPPPLQLLSTEIDVSHLWMIPYIYKGMKKTWSLKEYIMRALKGKHSCDNDV